jgi:glycosyltransferase involved in cell wall biosynthesis
MLGVQSPESRGRGIGRYGLSLASAMVRRGGRHEYVLYSHDDLPTDRFPNSSSAAIRRLEPAGATAGAAIEEVLRRNPDDLDALLLLSPFELYRDYDPPARPLGGPVTAAVVHDLIPFLFQERYMTWPPFAARFYRNLERLRRYDRLLTNSAHTRADCLRVLGMPAGRVVAVHGASDPEFFRPETYPEDRRIVGHVLGRFGIREPFVYCLGSMDERKNLAGLIDAFGMLPRPVRRSHQLVITFRIKEEEARTLREHADRWGIADQMILTGALPDEGIRALYQRCAAFAHPSTYEGLGLPLLEAMLCGAPVLAGNNTSQVEVVGDAGLLANASDPSDVSEHLALLLTDRPRAEDLGRRGRERAAGFRWDDCADRAIEALESAARPASPRRASSPPRARIAVVGPWPPKRSGVATYAARLVAALEDRYEIDLYHEPGYRPELAIGTARVRSFETRQLPRNAVSMGYRGVLYQMGNSVYHREVYELLQRHPGIVTLHDYVLANFHDWYDRVAFPGSGHLDRELCRERGAERAREILRALDAWAADAGGRAEALADRSIPLNRAVFEHAEAVVLHSETFLARAREDHPDAAGRLAHVPHGAEIVRVTPEARAAARERFGLPRDGRVVASFGILHPTKMNAETIEAFAPLAAEFPDALLVMVGRDLSPTPVAERAEELGLGDRVRFLGHQSREGYLAMLRAADVGIGLRRPPTKGETSGALLDLLRHGVPTIVNEAGSFADYPDDVVAKVRWERDGVEGLRAMLRELLRSAPGREALGSAAIRHVADRHDWALVAGQYAEIIELCAERRRGSSPTRAAC